MKSVEFEQVNVRIAENQEEYETLPAFYNENDGTITYCFELDNKELEQIGKTGKIYIQQLTGGRAMQPIRGTVLKEVLLSNQNK